ISRYRYGPATPRQALEQRPRYRGKLGETAMNWPCGRTPAEHDLVRIIQRETEKLATTTGGEPVHNACGDRRGRIHRVDVSTAPKRMQGSYRVSVISIGAIIC